MTAAAVATRPALSPHFSWAEVEHSSTAARLRIDNTLPDILVVNAARMAQFMECVRERLGEVFLVSSWYRCPVLNTAVGSGETSVHKKALAVDGRPASIPLERAFDMLVGSGLPYDQLIIERTKSGSAWLHIGLSEGRHRRQALRASGDTLGGPMTFTRVVDG